MPGGILTEFAPLLTHEEVGALIGVSRAMVENIEKKALAKLNAELEKLGLSAEDVFPRRRNRGPTDRRIEQMSREDIR